MAKTWLLTLMIMALACGGLACGGGSLSGGKYIVLEVDLPKLHQQDPHADDEAAVNRTIEILRRRLAGGFAAEPQIARQGTDRIIVQLPASRDGARDLQLIQNMAALEFKLVHDELADETGELPEGYARAPLIKKDENGQYRAMQELVVRSRPEMTGEHIARAEVKWDDMGIGGRRPIIAIEFDEIGAQQFAQLTAANVQRQLAIVIDGQVISVPKIQAAIRNGKAVIAGDFTEAEADALCIILESGALPAPLNIIEERTIQ